MPKPKPDQVIRHEIVLSRPLQETVDSLTATTQFKNVADPVVRLLNDVTGFATFLGILASLGLTGVAFDYMYGGEDTPLQVFNNWTLRRANAMAEKLGVPEGGIYDPIQNPSAGNPLEIFFAQLGNILT
tara:strand:+ start:150 stop:536 length:387 start_codon:yes stop_codon:yes gene_type:complete